jgi:hypothetical protein
MRSISDFRLKIEDCRLQISENAAVGLKVYFNLKSEINNLQSKIINLQTKIARRYSFIILSMVR